MFGAKIPQVDRLIKQRQNQFNKTPLGPVGAHVKLTGENNFKVMTILDKFCGVLFFVFIPVCFFFKEYSIFSNPSDIIIISLSRLAMIFLMICFDVL